MRSQKKSKREDREERKTEKKGNFCSDIVPDTLNFPVFQGG